MRKTESIVVATTNLHKLEEIRVLFGKYGQFSLTPISDVVRNSEKLKYVESKFTYEENALAKARVANMGSHEPVFSDDSGIEVECLGWGPGPRSNRFGIPKAGQSQDEANRMKLIEEIEKKLGKNPTDSQVSARFVSAVALTIEGVSLVGTGVLNGKISMKPAGQFGFGYDSLFVPEGYTKTFAEMSFEEKNSISHRSKAIENLFEKIRTNGIVLAKP